MGARPGVPPTRAFWVMPLMASVRTDSDSTTKNNLDDLPDC
jgi:hypothetical protein